MSERLSGADFKKQLRAGTPKLGLFVNSHSPTVAEQLAFSGYDWMLVDTQHGPMGNETLSGMLAGIANGGAASMVRVGGYADRPGIQQALDMGSDGVLVPYINTADEAAQAASCCRYPTAGTRSVYFPQRSMNKGGLLGYAGAANDNVIVALQVETASCIENIQKVFGRGFEQLAVTNRIKRVVFDGIIPGRAWVASWSIHYSFTEEFTGGLCKRRAYWTVWQKWRSGCSQLRWRK
jgi:4-hydroxy-2-oxoheptanedioate aldolase